MRLCFYRDYEYVVSTICVFKCTNSLIHHCILQSVQIPMTVLHKEDNLKNAVLFSTKASVRIGACRQSRTVKFQLSPSTSSRLAPLDLYSMLRHNILSTQLCLIFHTTTNPSPAVHTRPGMDTSASLPLHLQHPQHTQPEWVITNTGRDSIQLHVTVIKNQE